LILVDTSVWVDHFKSGNVTLEALLDIGSVLIHPFVVGELALGTLPQRVEVLKALDDLPMASVASNEEVRRFIEDHGLFGRGVGYVDVHLLAAVRLTRETELWTHDRRLRTIAEQFGSDFTPPAS
jgi:predicted nucleic acid-binding protein